ncbi:MAG: lysylphosphatidylglycerol synthase domain-containing protein [Chloroflexi bacterium]|nr:lysylphosphatidylglycerol synthase domain-containing protein [Chloroflexota bacterium]
MHLSLKAVKLRTWAGYAAGLAVLCVVYLAVRKEAGAIQSAAPTVTLWGVLISLTAGVAASVLSAWSWTAALRTLGLKCSFADAGRVWYASMLARYAPGTIPGVAYRVYLTTGLGASAGLATAATALDWVLWVLSGLLGALLTAPWWLGSAGLPFHLSGPYLILAAGSIVLASLLLLHPRSVALLVRKATAKTRSEPGEKNRETSGTQTGPETGVSAAANGDASPLTYRHTLALLPVYLAKWPFYGVSVAAFLPAIGHGSAAGAQPLIAAWMSRLAASTGAFAAGWLAGFISPLSPGGIGVREGIIVGVLHGAAAGSSVLGAALLSRLTTTAVEVLCWGWTARRRRQA